MRIYKTFKEFWGNHPVTNGTGLDGINAYNASRAAWVEAVYSFCNRNLTIPLDNDALADLLDSFATDWPEVLEFLARLAEAQGLAFNKASVSKLMKERYARD